MTMKKPSIHDFDAHGRASINTPHLEAEVDLLSAEVERLKRIVMLQEKRWRTAHGLPEPIKPTLH